MRLEDADVYAARVVRCIENLCSRIQVAGSVRRRRPTVQDIDIVAVPRDLSIPGTGLRPTGDSTWNGIATRLKVRLNMREIRKGKELITMAFNDVDLQVDVYRAQPETWGVLLLIRTGSIDHNIMMCSHARRMGMMLSAARGVIKDGQVIASLTEEEIFKALEMDFVAPQQREI